MNEVVLFDNDGVLVDSLDVTDRAWTQWSEEYGLDPAEVLSGIHGRPAWMSMEVLLPPEQRAEGLERIVEIELAGSHDLRPIPGAVELLDSIPADRAAIFTSATHALGLARLTSAGIPIPKVLLTAEDVTLGKPEPEGWITAARLLGAKPADAVVLEDSRNGILAARAAGVGRVIGVGEATRDYDVDAVVPDLTACRWDGERLVVG